MAAPARAHSGIQLSVLALFRDALRAARRLPPPAAAAAGAYVRAEFRAGATRVDRLDFQRVEHLIRAARKKVDSLKGADSFRVS